MPWSVEISKYGRVIPMKRAKVSTDEAKIDELLTRGVEEVIVKEDLKKKLLSGKQLRIKLGIDPTSPNLHLGRSVPLLKMRDFQELGHQVVLIVGDFTGVIGDTSDKESERPMLMRNVIEKNKKSYFKQIGTLIAVEQAELRYNSEWLGTLGYGEIGEHADQFSIADFTARDNIRKRLDAGKRVSLREVLYPLMQGYDSVAVKADVELGGVDQRFNLLAGRTLQEHFEQPPQNIVMTTFPIEGPDGRKMSSSWGNTINFTDLAEDMFGKIMSVRDELLLKYFTLLTRIPLSEIKEILYGHPKEAKMRLAREIVTLYHGEKAARGAEQHFTETFQQGKVPEKLLTIKVLPKEVGDELVRAKIVVSKSELMRLLKAGGVRNAETGEKIEAFPLSLSKSIVIRVGKRRFVKIEPKKDN